MSIMGIVRFWQELISKLATAINMALAFCMGTDLEALYDADQPMAMIFQQSFGDNATLGIWAIIVIVQYMMGSSMVPMPLSTQLRGSEY